MKSLTRASALLIVGMLLGVVAPTATTAECGWLLWAQTKYFRQDGADPGAGFSDRWSAEDGYDTAADCHAAATIKAESIDKTVNEYSVKRTPVAFVTANKCFPVGFDPRKE